MKRSTPVLGVVLAVLAGTTLAQQYPTRPVRVIAAQSAGSSLDTLARIVTPKMSDILGQQLVIDNRGGAAGTIGLEIAVRRGDE
jgi:tripartite-type tricarboxylate transporter receptor subunit TctC